MTESGIDVEAALADLKDFQRRTAVWAFERMFAEEDPAIRFLVADEVGLGKTHIAKGVIAQAIDHLQRTGDKRHDIVYICSNAAIARQNIRKLVPAGIEPVTGADRLTMLPLVQLEEGRTNLLPITPGTSLNFGRSTGRFPERCLAYTYLRAHWGRDVMNRRARRIFWHGIWADDPDGRLKKMERSYRPHVQRTLEEFARRLDELDESRIAQGKPDLLAVFDELAGGLKHQRSFPRHLLGSRMELIAEVRRVMATVGITALQPDLVVLDEFQRFKDLLRPPQPGDFAGELAHRLFNSRDPDSGRATRTLLLSATPYRMYTMSDEIEEDHYEDFLDTCAFLFGDRARLEGLESRFRDLRTGLTSADPLNGAERACRDIERQLRGVMARTERLSATPDRDGMLRKSSPPVRVLHHDLRAYLRFDGIAETVGHHQPTEYWKSGPYLVNFMENYKFKEAVVQAVKDGQLADGGMLEPGPGLLDWDDVDAYQDVDPQNGRLRWLLDDLAEHRAFELLWVPPSMRYYDTGSVYESPEATGFTKRLIFSGWTVVPKVVSSLVSFEAERRAFAARDHRYSTKYRRRGGQRLRFRTTERTGPPRPGEAAGERQAAAMTALLTTWPSPSLAEVGDPRPQIAPRPRSNEQLRDGIGARTNSDNSDGTSARTNREDTSRSIEQLRDEVGARVADAIEPLVRDAPTSGTFDQRWYWAAPLLLDREQWPEAVEFLLDTGNAWYFQGSGRDDEGARSAEGLHTHLDEARAMVAAEPGVLGRPPDDLAEVLTDLALGGPAQCALRMICSVARLDASDEGALANAAWVGGAFRHYFNAPEVTAVIEGGGTSGSRADEGVSRYWQDVVRHCVDGNLQAVLDEHGHVLRDWLGHLSPADADRRREAACGIATKMAEALELRTSSYRVDVPVRKRKGRVMRFDGHRMRTRFAVAFANQTLERGGEARVESVTAAFNSPFWPFVLTSTSIGQEGLDFHLWCHAVVHWNLPYNPVDLEQREGRVHRYKGHAVRRNIALSHGPEMLAFGCPDSADPWDELFSIAAGHRERNSEMVPYWVYDGPAKIERYMPVLPFSREQAALPRLHKALAAYRLAFGQPRQEELVEFLGASFSEEQLTRLAMQFRIDLSPPEPTQTTDS